MLTRIGSTIIVAAALLPFAALAQEGGDGTIDALELTMELMPEGATLPDAVTRVIELPEAAVEAARQNAAPGLETANEARGSAERGLDIAAEARERGLEQAQDNRENAGRGPPDGAVPPGVPGVPDGLPGGPQDGPPGLPDAPGGPDDPGPPEG